ncbi:uncharacterized protein BDW43DRAFT_136725 [Aspergillus alliaceus]|uniref:uncharacterized protein n=1 Tax=Petromyces alliaceus TaxID=209559 RepID=UPI0012A448F5|nr:uncharacterized protein BDW43DRAFT_136725 [Aspergillus alliaceus]KAB8231429.1 hypothetical protein BDW43DRAFT_136725 [Aspergillus alliaceus]
MAFRCVVSDSGVLHNLHGLVVASIALITYVDDNHILSSLTHSRGHGHGGIGLVFFSAYYVCIFDITEVSGPCRRLGVCWRNAVSGDACHGPLSTA